MKQTSTTDTQEHDESEDLTPQPYDLSLWTGRSARGGGRVHSYDVARAVAFLGMALVNLRASWPEEAKALSERAEDLLGFVQGRSASTFVVLAGIGLTLSKQRYQRRASSSLDLESHITRRAVVLMAVGLMFSVFWTLDILHFYAVYLILSLFFLSASVQRLLLGGAIFVLGSWFAPIQLGLSADFTPDGIASIGEYYVPIATLLHLLCVGPHPVFPWMAFVLFGIWFGREPIQARRQDWRVWFVGGLFWLGGEALSKLALSRVRGPQRDEWSNILDTSPFPGFGFFALSNIGTATLIILLCSVLADWLEGKGWLNLFSYMGQTMLSLYILHAVLIEVGLAYTAKSAWSADQRLLIVYGFIVITSALSAYLWRKRFDYGPLEMLMNYFVRYTGHHKTQE